MIRNKRYPRGGFTLIELLVVVLIIGILAAIALPQYRRVIVKSKYARAKQTAGDLRRAYELYYTVHNEFPTKFSDLDFAYKFDEKHSIGNEEDRELEKNSTFANVALWILSGGIFGIISVLLDFKKFKIAGVKLSGASKAIAIIACFVPFLGILADYKFKKAFEELEKKHGVELKSKRFVPSMIIFACIPVPYMINVYSLAIRTDMFNKISDKLYNENK